MEKVLKTKSKIVKQKGDVYVPMQESHRYNMIFNDLGIKNFDVCNKYVSKLKAKVLSSHVLPKKNQFNVINIYLHIYFDD